MIEVNSRVMLSRGKTYPFVSIASLIPNSKPVEAHEYSEYKSDGSKFGKTAQVKNLQGGEGVWLN